MKNKNYKVITPGGNIYVQYASEAKEYKDLKELKQEINNL